MTGKASSLETITNRSDAFFVYQVVIGMKNPPGKGASMYPSWISVLFQTARK